MTKARAGVEGKSSDPALEKPARVLEEAPTAEPGYTPFPSTRDGAWSIMAVHIANNVVLRTRLG